MKRFGAPSLSFALICSFLTACGADSTANSTPPSAPTWGQITPMIGGLHLEWNRPTEGCDFVEIERKSPTETYGRVGTPVPCDLSSYHDSKTNDDVVYAYRLRASKSSGASDYSEEKSERPVLAPLWNSIARSANGVLLKWTSRSACETLKVERKVGTDAYSSVGEFACSLAEWEDTTATDTETYVYRLVSSRNGAASPYSDERSVNPKP